MVIIYMYIAVELVANCHTGEVTVKQVGSNSSALDGIELLQNKDYKMKPSSTLFILTGLYPQKLKIVDKRNSGDPDKNNLDEINKIQNGESSTQKDDSKEKKDKNNSSEPNKKKHSEKSRSKEKDLNKSKDSDSDKKHSNKSVSDKSKGDSKTGTKRPNSSDNDSVFKKPKLSSSEDKKTNDKKSVKFCDNVDKATSNSIGDDDNHLTDVAAKLKALKDNAKKVKIPEKVKTSEKESATACVSSGKAVTKGYWEKIESLYVYRSESLTGKAKVNENIIIRQFVYLPCKTGVEG